MATTTSMHCSDCSSCSAIQAQPVQQSKKYLILLKTIDVICGIALTAFSLYMNYILFLAFCFVGVVIGVCKTIQDVQQKGVNAATACSQGLLEQIFQIKMPKPVSTGLNTAITLAHLDHHAEVFVPVVALFIGAWIGKHAVNCYNLYCRKVTAVTTK